MKKKLLLHSCCAPCSTVVIQTLASTYDITVFYYNPNIEPFDEYTKRKEEQIRFIKEYNPKINIIIGDYDNNLYQNKIEKYKNLGERSLRCYECFDLRIEKTVKYAFENNYDLFETTLSVSPYKNSSWVSEISNKYSSLYNIEYLNGNYKKNNGYQKSIDLSKQHHLYRQNYCGCLMSSNNL